MDDWFEREFADTQVMVIMRGLDADASLALAERAWAAGVRMVEIPIQTPAAVAALRVVAAAARGRGLVVGAGTVVTGGSRRRGPPRRRGVHGEPGVDEEVVRASLAAGLPTLPGVATASDIQRCARLGVNWLKAFPAATLGPGWITRDARTVPRRKVRGHRRRDGRPTRAEFLAAGARAVSLGSALADPAQLDALSRLAPRE